MAAAHLKIRQIAEALTKRLNCTQKVLCSFLGVSETALSTSMDKLISDAGDNKVGKRLLSLLYVVETLARDESLTAITIKKVLVAPYFRQEDGSYLDVISAIHMGNIQNDLLTPIADAALKHFRKSYEEEKWPIENGLYNQAKQA